MRYSLHRCNSLYYLPSCVAPDVGGLPWTVPRPFHREPAIQGQASLSFPVVFSNTKQTDGRMNRISSSSVHLELEPGALGPLLQSYPDLVLLDFVRALVDFDFHGELGHGERVPSLAHDARHVEAELPEPDLDAVLVHAVDPGDRQVHGNVLVPVAPTVLVNGHHGLRALFVVELDPRESFLPPASFPALSVRALGQSHDNSEYRT
mmetsp:Transcript_341/g.550  ORF Transcript_341/g.550 Transcript_341/m.550 type:complete len:206 (-) Transcript_341:46-663(-)